MSIHLEPRRIPRQERSRERVEAILSAARQLIGERGNDAVSMREIAAAAKVPVSSVYQYFPDKNAILRQLIVSYLGDVVTGLEMVLDAVSSPDGLARALDQMVDVLVEAFRTDPAFLTIWSAVQANTVLRELDAEDGRRIADVLTARFLSLLPGLDPDEVRSACLFAVHSSATTVRMALIHSDPTEGAGLIQEYKTLMRLRLQSFMAAPRNARQRR